MPEAARLDHQIDETGDRVKQLRRVDEDRTTWLREHPEATSQLEAIERELNPLSDVPAIHQDLSRLLAPRNEPDLQRGIEHGPDLGIEIGF